MRPVRTILIGAAILAGAVLSAAFAEAEGGAPGGTPHAVADAPDLAKVVFVKDGKLDLEAAVKYFEDLYRSDSSISVAEMTVVRPRTTRTMRMKMWTRGQDKALVVIESPAREKGTATLKVDNSLWNYLPHIRRTIRIPPSMMLASWMGSDLTNDDLVRESSLTEDYVYKLAGRSEDPPGWLVVFTAKPDTVGLWNRFEVVLSDDGTIPVAARYYDRKDRLARVIDWDQVKEFDGKVIPARMVLVPLDKEEEGNRTEFVYLEIDFDVDVAESTFSLSRLERKTR